MTNLTIESELAAFSTATLSDALDRLGQPGAVFDVTNLGSGSRTFGRAYTVRYVPASNPPGTVGDYIDDVPEGAVVVLDNQGRTDCTVWGDILTAVASARRIGGTVIDGVCRDTQRAFDLEYPIFSRGRFMRTGKDRVQVAAVQETVSIGGRQVAPGDLVIGDIDGVIVIPKGIETRLLDVASEIHEREEGILARALSGATIAEARAVFGYHDLQRREA